ncbi:efflux RND transporter periplasmic adaptor subunit [Floricoccus penangensis]|uniref:efflux RND transporter periplasmic adaptor subunit n=1 Tax=Floricoccus penangensis TaxID=1859475 RepID=UPI00203C45B5|nr:HlyD family efflux transporter periplasmic adaptor subunit [Floricoccus penangensis]URZ87349.1 HlyD family efflux transporter periplasmic adaptor subunit [Floricoccus penangensis]
MKIWQNKKLMIILGSILALIVVAFIGVKTFGQKNNKAAQIADTGDSYGIKYFEVPDVDQVFINGIVQPNQMQSFPKNDKNTSEPDIKVTNGQVVDEGTVLFTYEDKDITKEIENQKNTVNKLQTKRENTIAKWNRALANANGANASSKTEDKEGISGVQTSAGINEQYQSEIDGIDEEIGFANDAEADLQTKQYISTSAKFKGRVSIPEVKDANSPILRLTSEELYVAGKVSEKDLPKIKVGQQATLTSISNGTVVTGKISYIDDNPPENKTEQNQYGNNSSLSSYDVKITLDTLEGIKNGYHIQATVDVGKKEAVQLPKEAVHDSGDKKYVLVNDFGNVVRRDVQVGEEKDGKVTIKSGLESADRVIVSSEKPVKEGDIIGGGDAGQGPANAAVEGGASDSEKQEKASEEKTESK